MTTNAIDVTFEGEGTFAAEPGQNLLQVSTEAGLAHVSACGGKARCSTCRVLVLDGGANLGPRTEAAEILARQKGLEPEVRLACQTTVEGPVRVRRLVRDRADALALTVAPARVAPAASVL